jgi:hypothetical protein
MSFDIYDETELQNAFEEFKQKYRDSLNLDINIDISFVQSLILEAEEQVDDLSLYELNHWRKKLFSNSFRPILLLAYCYIALFQPRDDHERWILSFYHSLGDSTYVFHIAKETEFEDRIEFGLYAKKRFEAGDKFCYFEGLSPHHIFSTKVLE